MLLAKAKILLDNVYEKEEERDKLMKNEWFMGPFYKHWIIIIIVVIIIDIIIYVIFIIFHY